jgi:hypothetical protein
LFSFSATPQATSDVTPLPLKVNADFQLATRNSHRNNVLFTLRA